MPAMPDWKMPNWTAQLRGQNPDDDDEQAEEDFGTSVKTKKVGELTTVAGLNVITIESVGLVVGLDGTGDDPPPSRYRTQLLAEMRTRGVKNPNTILRSPNTALVVVRAYLPPLVKKGDHFDVEVRIPGTSEATSLNGGRLLETFLSEQAVVAGRGVLEGHVMARAAGPILISANSGSESSSIAALRRGRILGGGVSKTSRKLSMYLRSDYRSIRNSKRIAKRIGTRFFYYNRYGLRESLAEAKTDQKIELDIQPRYKENYPRYLQVIRTIAWNETEVAQRIRMQRLARELKDPTKSERAAYALEAIGVPSIPMLKDGLKSKSFECRFYSASSLAYLGESDGLEILAEAARSEPAFRIFAYSAMAACEEPETNLLLRDLMNANSAETRYGAFRALSVLDNDDPFIYGELLNRQFFLHELDTTGEPMIHLTHHKKAEVVIFGARQRLQTPVAYVLGHIL